MADRDDSVRCQCTSTDEVRRRYFPAEREKRLAVDVEPRRYGEIMAARVVGSTREVVRQAAKTLVKK